MAKTALMWQPHLHHRTVETSEGQGHHWAVYNSPPERDLSERAAFSVAVEAKEELVAVSAATADASASTARAVFADEASAVVSSIAVAYLENSSSASLQMPSDRSRN